MNAIAYILIVGQSLSVGLFSGPALYPAQPNPFALVFNTGVRPMGGTDDPLDVLNPASLGAFKTLHESDQGPYGETMATGLLQQTATRTLVASMGVSAQPYAAMAKGTIPFANAIATVQRAMDINGGNVVVTNIIVTHGESDFEARTSAAQYEADLLAWATDYCTAIKAITHQVACPKVRLDQMNSYTSSAYKTLASASSVIPGAQLKAAMDYPSIFTADTPKYMLDYAPDGVHLSDAGEEKLGEYHRLAIANPHWSGGVTPIRATNAGNTVVVSFHVPVAPLLLDEETVTDPGNFGFIYDDDCHSAHISYVHASGSVVGMYLNQVPTCGHRHISYAMDGIVGANAGPDSGARGCLHDSNGTPSQLDGQPLRNYSWGFDLPL